MARDILTDLDFNSASRILNLKDATQQTEPVTFGQLKAYRQVISQTSIVIDFDFSIFEGCNGLSVGDVEILQGVEVTVPEGSTWMII